ncbi:LPS-assembly protein LptD [Lyticum sinuosum]|uniref:LPS assembly protein LptD n=1 Tax=Lyticum sinuosum TaxID=1332059 RepID=A0AAE5AHF1_9RICK|nr:hypothetical protein [Lyticum sinuosum]MDZ5760951.1 putative LPS assembly protein LptD [Lyticum sinuosum]
MNVKPIIIIIINILSFFLVLSTYPFFDKKNQNIALEAENIIYTDEILRAIGNVNITDETEEITLKANSILWVPKKEFFITDGNVEIYDYSTQSKLFGDKFFFFGKKNEKIFLGKKVYAQLWDNKVILKAKNIYVSSTRNNDKKDNTQKPYDNQKIYKLDNFWITLCGQSPKCFGKYVWEFYGEDGTYQNDMIDINNVELSLCGLHIIKIPKFNYSINNGRLPTGLFLPKLYSISHEGFVIRIPYHYNVNDRIDIIIAPHLSLKKLLPIIYEFQLKHKFDNGGYSCNINTSYIKDYNLNKKESVFENFYHEYNINNNKYNKNYKDLNSKNELEKKVNAMIKLHGNFIYYNSSLELGFDINKLIDKDKTYAKKYLNNYDDIMYSTIYSHYSPNDRSFIMVEALELDDMRPYSPYKNLISFPRASFIYNSFIYQLGKWKYSYKIDGIIEKIKDNANFKKYNYKYNHNTNNQYLSYINIHYLNEYNPSIHSSSFDFKLQNNIQYNHSKNTIFEVSPLLSMRSTKNISEKSGFIIYPGVDFTLSKNLTIFNGQSIQVVEPIVRLKVSPYHRITVSPFNRQFLEYQAPTILSNNLRYYINDQLQSGSNLDYGVNWYYYGSLNFNISFGGNYRLYNSKLNNYNGNLNKSYHLMNDNIIPGSSIYPLNKASSTYNINASTKIGRNTISARTWLRPDLLTPVHIETDWIINSDNIIMIADYTFFDNNYYYGDPIRNRKFSNSRKKTFYSKKYYNHNEHEIGGDFWRRMNSDLWINFNARGKLNKYMPNDKNIITAGIGLRYQVDCFRIDFGLKKSNIKIRDLKPSLIYYFDVGVPILGF